MTCARSSSTSTGRTRRQGAVPGLGFTPTLNLDGPIDQAPIGPDLHAAILAVLREALSNVARHSQATSASLGVVVTADDIRIMIRDNGIGISASDVLGNGRQNLHSRAKQLGGDATVYNAHRETGVVVEWTVPLDGVRRHTRTGPVARPTWANVP